MCCVMRLRADIAGRHSHFCKPNPTVRQCKMLGHEPNSNSISVVVVACLETLRACTTSTVTDITVCRSMRSDYPESRKWTFAEVNISTAGSTILVPEDVLELGVSRRKPGLNVRRSTIVHPGFHTSRKRYHPPSVRYKRM